MIATSLSKVQVRQNVRSVSLTPKGRVRSDARRYIKVMAGTWDTEHHRQKIKDAGFSYKQAVAIVDAINSGMGFAIQEVKSRYTPVFAKVLKKQESLSGEMGTVGKEVLAVQHSPAQTVQDVEACFTPMFAEILDKQEKVSGDVGKVMDNFEMQEHRYQTFYKNDLPLAVRKIDRLATDVDTVSSDVDKVRHSIEMQEIRYREFGKIDWHSVERKIDRLDETSKRVETLATVVYWGGAILLFMVFLLLRGENAALDRLAELASRARILPK